MPHKLKLFIFIVLCSTAWLSAVQSADSDSGQILGGSLNSPIKIEVFSDFQCNACREFYLATIRRILNEYSSKNKVCVIYYENPLKTHKYSRAAARYVTAASRMGLQKVLSIMEILFMDQAQWSQDGNIDASVSKVLRPAEFMKLKTIMQDTSINTAIDKELQLGVLKKVESTPTLFISEHGKQRKVEGLVTYPVMKQFIDRIVK
jgi:protein-disulfide isomerase